MLILLLMCNTDTPFNNNLRFSVGRSSGNLTVNGTIDRETFSRYFVTISVSSYYIIYTVTGTDPGNIIPWG